MIATAEILANKSEAWRGTAFICAQPAEETGQGARQCCVMVYSKDSRVRIEVLQNMFRHLPLELLATVLA